MTASLGAAPRWRAALLPTDLPDRWYDDHRLREPCCTLLRTHWHAAVVPAHRSRIGRPIRTHTAAIATAAFAATVPATVVGWIPRWLAGRSPARPPSTVQRHAGTALIAAGLPLVADGFVRFVRSRGTPAPIAETEELVSSGPYRWMRNPQYVGIVATVTGQGLRWNSFPVLGYAAYLAVAFHTWVRIYEEPRLAERFGDAYADYTATVPRWPNPLAW